jgi:hypothetical protein
MPASEEILTRDQSGQLFKREYSDTEVDGEIESIVLGSVVLIFLLKLTYLDLAMHSSPPRGWNETWPCILET